MIDYVKMLREFHKAVFTKTGSWMSDTGQRFIPGNSTATLRDYLHQEECDEVSKELMEGEDAALLKELCDLLYVVFGTAVTYGFPIEEAFIEVHKDNMAKLVKGTVGKNGKFIKPAGWKKVDLQPLLDIQKEIKDKQDAEGFVFFE